MRLLQSMNAAKLMFVGAMLLPMSGLMVAGGCVVREKERVVDRPRRVVVEERPRVIERDQTIIERR